MHCPEPSRSLLAGEQDGGALGPGGNVSWRVGAMGENTLILEAGLAQKPLVHTGGPCRLPTCEGIVLLGETGLSRPRERGRLLSEGALRPETRTGGVNWVGLTRGAWAL